MKVSGCGVETTTDCIAQVCSSNYRVFPSNKQKQNWKIDTSLVAIGAQNLFLDPIGSLVFSVLVSKLATKLEN